MSENNEFTFEHPQYRKTYWHTCSHVMAQAVKRLYPEVKLAIGPSPPSIRTRSRSATASRISSASSALCCSCS